MPYEYQDLDAFLDELAEKKKKEALESGNVDSFLDQLATQRAQSERAPKKEKTFLQHLAAPWWTFGGGLVRGVGSKILDPLDFLSQLTMSPMQRAYLKQRPSIAAKASDFFKGQGEQLTGAGLEQGTSLQGFYDKLGEMLPTLVALKGLGSTGMGFSALPAYGAVEGGKEGGWVGAAAGAAGGALMGGTLGAIRRLPSAWRAPVALGTGYTVSQGTPAERLVEGGLWAGLSMGGPKLSKEEFFRKPLQPLNDREVEIIKRIKERMYGPEKLDPEDILKPTIPELTPESGLRNYGFGNSKNFNIKLGKAIPDILKAHEAEGGSTYNLFRGNLIGKKFFAVSIFPDTEISKPIKGRSVSTQALRDFAWERRDLLRDPRLSIGTWYKADTDTTVLDVVATVANRDLAISLGKQANREAIFDLYNKKDIPVGGTGTDPGNLPPIPGRLNDMTLPYFQKEQAGVGKYRPTVALKDKDTGKVYPGFPGEIHGDVLNKYKLRPDNVISGYVTAGGEWTENMSVARESMKQTVPPIDLFHFTRSLGGTREVIDPQAMGQAQMGEEGRQILPSGEMKEGYLAKSNYYTRETPTIESHRWVGATAYGTEMPRELLKVIKKGESIPKNIDLLTAEEGKAGWYDENSGQVRMLTPEPAERLGFSLTKKGKTIAGKDIDTIIDRTTKTLDEVLATQGLPGTEQIFPPKPVSLQAELESRSASLSKREQKVLQMLRSGKVGEEEAKILSIIADPEIRSLIHKKPAEVIMALETELVDRFAPARKFVQQVEELTGKLVDFDKNIFNLLHLYPGRFGLQKLAFDELRNIFKPVLQYKQALEEYGISERGKERWGRDIKNPEYLPGKELGRRESLEAQWAMAKRLGPGVYAKIKTATDQFYDWSDKWILQTLEDANLISPKLHQTIKLKNQRWFPFEAMKYVEEDFDRMTVGSEFFSVRGQDIVKAMTGAKGKILPPFESIVSTMNRAITLAEKNKILVNLIKYRELDPAMKKIIVPVGLTEKIGDTSTYDDIKVVLNGKVTRWLVPKDLGSTLKNMDMKTADLFTKFVKSSSSLFRAGTTGWYIPFTLGNAPRDFKMALLCSRAGFNPINWTQGIVHGLAASFGFPTQLYKDYLKSKGSFGGLMQRTPHLTVEKLFEPRGVEIAKEAALFIKNISSAVELAPRLAVFNRARGKGFAIKRPWIAGSEMEAGLASRRATIDFSQAGNLMQVLNQYVPFVNARLQAKVILFGNIANPETRTATIAKAVAWVMLPSLSAYFYNVLHHPNVYSEIPEYVKDNYDVVVMGTKKDEQGRNVPDYFKLAKGDTEQAFVNPIITFLEHARQKEPQKIHEIAINWFSEMSPIPFAREGKPSLSRFLAGGVPPIARAPIEYVMGKSLFTERETVPWELKRLKPEEQYTKKTPQMYKALGKTMGASPLKLQALAKNLAGSAFYWPTPEGMASLLAGRVRGTTGGESLNKAYKLQKKAEEGYFTAREGIKNQLSKGNYSAAYRKQDEWNRDFISVLIDMGKLTGQRLDELFESPFYKMYSFQDKDMKTLERGEEFGQESFASGLEKKLNYKFYENPY